MTIMSESTFSIKVKFINYLFLEAEYNISAKAY